MAEPDQMRPRAIACLPHYLYEYRKGVRHLFMLTMTPHEAKSVQKRLEQEAIDFFVQAVSVPKVNLFFGSRPWVETARAIVTRPVHQLTPEQDFMLGTLLGYDREQQCLRYLARSGHAAADPALPSAAACTGP